MAWGLNLDDQARMPRYFFHLADGTVLPDEEGLELHDALEAWRTSLGFLSDMIRIRRGDLGPGDSWTVTVIEEDAPCWKLSFATEAVVPDPCP